MLAGGYATRLRPISYAMPKLLFPVLGKPMIYWTLDLLKAVGVDEVVLAVNYLANLLSDEIGSHYDRISIKYSHETEPLGTGGPIKLASQETSLDETFIAMNGDVIANIDLRGMMNHHEQTKSSITDALHEVQNPGRFGVVKLDSKGRIGRFVEKPRASEAPSRLVNAGVYIIEPEVLQLIPPNRKVSLEREIFPILAKDGKLGGFPFSGEWFDIGSISDYRKANFSFLGKNTGVFPGHGVQIGDDAVVRPPVFLREGSEIETKASVGPRVIAGKDTLIRDHAKLSHSILFDGVTIGPGSIVEGAILASGVNVGKRAKIESGSIVSPYVQIHDGVRIGRRAIIHPHKEVQSNVRPETHLM